MRNNKMNICKFLIPLLVITLSSCNKIDIADVMERVESRKMFLPINVTLLKSSDYENIRELPFLHDADIIGFEGSTLKVDPEDIINDDNIMNFKKNKDYLVMYENDQWHTAFSVKLNDEEGLFFISRNQFNMVFDILTASDIDDAEIVYKEVIKGTNLDRNLSDLNETDIKEYKGALRSDVVSLQPGRRDHRFIIFEP